MCMQEMGEEARPPVELGHKGPPNSSHISTEGQGGERHDTKVFFFFCMRPFCASPAQHAASACQRCDFASTVCLFPFSPPTPLPHGRRNAACSVPLTVGIMRKVLSQHPCI